MVDFFLWNSLRISCAEVKEIMGMSTFPFIVTRPRFHFQLLEVVYVFPLNCNVCFQKDIYEKITSISLVFFSSSSFLIFFGQWFSRRPPNKYLVLPQHFLNLTTLCWPYKLVVCKAGASCKPCKYHQACLPADLSHTERECYFMGSIVLV